MSRLIRASAALAFAALLAACDTSGSPASSTSVVDYRASDGRTVKLHIDEGYDGAERAFATSQEYVETLESLRSSATDLTLNRSVWETLKSSNDPFIVSLLGADASVTVGEDVYRATPTAVYRTPISDPSASPSIELYYGADGLEKYREINALHAFASMPGELSRMAFHNPDVQSMADRVVEEGGDHTEAPVQGRTSSGSVSPSSARLWGTERQYSPNYYIRTDAGNYWYVRITGYNQDYGSWWQGYSAAGATQLQVYSYADNQWGAIGFGDRPYTLGTQVDIGLLLKRDAPSSAWNNLTCVSGRSQNRELYFNNCNLLNTSGNRATGWDPKSEHSYIFYQASPTEYNPFRNAVVASDTLFIN